ncbi:DUF982 domain-containing protein [Neorhizobium sp. Rsf11]|uniref:DUF982 domain-containing protein n=1 Tax=Neorhizobium phenanthreniclasticum TaxID=3157917 RepID=A0ABV0M9S8_9HYPH
MLVNRWEKPVVFDDDGLRITIGSPEEAMTWLSQASNRDRDSFRKAWRKCLAAREGRLPADEARPAVERAVESTRH